MLKEILGKTSDYLFGFGDKKDYFNLAKEYDWAFESEGEQRINNPLLKSDRLARIVVRSITTSLQAIMIYYAITQRDYRSLLALPILEIPRTFSLLADYINKKRILKKKDKSIEDFFNPEQAEEKRDRKNNSLDINDADWWKK